MGLKVKCQKMAPKVRRLVLKGAPGHYFHRAAQSSYDCHFPGAPTWLYQYALLSSNVPIVNEEGEKKF